MSRTVELDKHNSVQVYVNNNLSFKIEKAAEILTVMDNNGNILYSANLINGEWVQDFPWAAEKVWEDSDAQIPYLF